jgi:hypothetical protein
LVIYMGSLGISCAFLMSMVHHQLLVTLRKFLISHYGFIYNRYNFGACLLVCIMWTIFNWRKLLIQLFFRVFKHGYRCIRYQIKITTNLPTSYIYANCFFISFHIFGILLSSHP